MDDVLRQRSINLKTAVTHMIAGDADLAVHSLGSDVREVPPDRLADTITSDEVSHDVTFCVTSLTAAPADAANIRERVRAPWTMDNR